MKLLNKRTLNPEQSEQLLKSLKSRFESNMHRNKDLDWNKIQLKLEANLVKMWSLNQMEETGGEPDVIGYDKNTDEYFFFDCSKESPKGRRSLCFDREARERRKEPKPVNSAEKMADEMGIEILTERQYFQLQQTGVFDSKTSSWIATPKDIRELGGALFGDWRFGRVFIYHNGADSYFAARGFRGCLKV